MEQFAIAVVEKSNLSNQVFRLTTTSLEISKCINYLTILAITKKKATTIIVMRKKKTNCFLLRETPQSNIKCSLYY